MVTDDRWSVGASSRPYRSGWHVPASTSRVGRLPEGTHDECMDAHRQPGTDPIGSESEWRNCRGPLRGAPSAEAGCDASHPVRNPDGYLERRTVEWRTSQGDPDPPPRTPPSQF